jgi:hypothetical protein
VYAPRAASHHRHYPKPLVAYWTRLRGCIRRRRNHRHPSPLCRTTLDTTRLPLLDPNESHVAIVRFFDGPEGHRIIHSCYIEFFLHTEYRVDHYHLLEESPLILEVEFSLYVNEEGTLSERFPPVLIDYNLRLARILGLVRDFRP